MKTKKQAVTPRQSSGQGGNLWGKAELEAGFNAVPARLTTGVL